MPGPEQANFEAAVPKDLLSSLKRQLLMILLVVGEHRPLPEIKSTLPDQATSVQSVSVSLDFKSVVGEKAYFLHSDIIDYANITISVTTPHELGGEQYWFPIDVITTGKVNDEFMHDAEPTEVINWIKFIDIEGKELECSKETLYFRGNESVRPDMIIGNGISGVLPADAMTKSDGLEIARWDLDEDDVGYIETIISFLTQRRRAGS